MAVRPRLPYTAPLIDPKTNAITTPWAAFFTTLVDQQPPPAVTPWSIVNNEIILTSDKFVGSGFALTDIPNSSLANSTIEIVNGNNITGGAIVPLGGSTVISVIDNPVFTGTGSISLPVGTTASRPSASTPQMLRYNSTLDQIETYTTDDQLWHENAWVGQTTTENGFVDAFPGTTSTLSFDNGTRTFTITPTGVNYSVWAGGKQFIKTAAESVIIPNTEGMYYFYFDTDGVLQQTATFVDDIIITYSFVGQLYWNATAQLQIFFGDERHGRVMDSEAHLYLHNTQHSKWASGLGLTGVPAGTGTGALDADVQFGVAAGIIWDEDLQHSITATASGAQTQVLTTPAQIPVFFRSGALGNWKRFVTSTIPLAYGGRVSQAAEITAPGARASWNQFTAGAWQLTETSNQNFVLVHYFATNNLAEPVIAIVGQSEYTTKANAQAGALVELQNLSYGNLPTLEFTPIASVIYQTSNSYANTAKSRISITSSGGPYVDWRSGTISGAGSSAAAITISDDVVTNSTFFPTFTALTSGTLAVINTSSSKLTYNPSTGNLTAVRFAGSGAGLTSIPNSALTNSSLTVGSTAIALGSSSTTLAGLTSVSSTLFTGALTGAATTAGTVTTAAQPSITSVGTLTGLSLSGSLSTTNSIIMTGAGQLLQGTNTSYSVGGTPLPFQQHNTAITGNSLTRWAAAPNGPFCVFGKSRGAAVGTFAAVVSGDVLGTTLYAGDDGTNLASVASSISTEVDGTVSTGVVPGRILFKTATTGGVLTERLRISASGLSTFTGNVTATNFNGPINYTTIGNSNVSFQVPITGFSITIAAGVSTLMLDPAGTLATGTIIMPAAPADGLIINIGATQTITALTVSANSGQSIKNAPTTLTVSLIGAQGYQYIYRLSNTTWYRLQ